MMGTVQCELVNALLDRILALGLISEAVCSRAKDRAAAAADIPALKFLDEGGGQG